MLKKALHKKRSYLDLVGNWRNFLLFTKNVIRVKESFRRIKHFTDCKWDKFLDSAWREESNFITAAFFDIERETVDHVKRPIWEDSLLVFVNKDSNFLTFSEFRTDENIGFFPVNIEFALDFLVNLRSDMERVNSLRLNGVWFNIIVIHFIGVSCCVLSLPCLLIHIIFIKNAKILLVLMLVGYYWAWDTKNINTVMERRSNVFLLCVIWYLFVENT